MPFELDTVYNMIDFIVEAELTLGGVMIEMLVFVGEGSSAIERSVFKPSSSSSFCTRHISNYSFLSLDRLPYRMYWSHIEAASFVPIEHL